jgi:hypothetical protein
VAVEPKVDECTASASTRGLRDRPQILCRTVIDVELSSDRRDDDGGPIRLEGPRAALRFVVFDVPVFAVSTFGRYRGTTAGNGSNCYGWPLTAASRRTPSA